MISRNLETVHSIQGQVPISVLRFMPRNFAAWLVWVNVWGCVSTSDAQERSEPWLAEAPPGLLSYRGPLPQTALASGPRARRLLSEVAEVRASLRTGSYSHRTRVDVRQGIYHWDCSSMMTWLLRRTAPSLVRQISRPRPVARDYARLITRATPRSRSLTQVHSIEDVEPGDLFAWERPRGFPSSNTGHAGVVVSHPIMIQTRPRVALLRIVDATSFGHQDDSRPEGSPGGIGEGVMAFLIDERGAATAYGWFGSASPAFIVTPVRFGRLGP